MDMLIILILLNIVLIFIMAKGDIDTKKHNERLEGLVETLGNTCVANWLDTNPLIGGIEDPNDYYKHTYAFFDKDKNKMVITTFDYLTEEFVDSGNKSINVEDFDYWLPIPTQFDSIKDAEGR